MKGKIFTVGLAKHSLETAATDLRKRLDKHGTEALHKVTVAVSEHIKVIAGVQMKIIATVYEKDEKSVIETHDPKAAKIEEELHPFEYTRNALPKIFSTIKW